MAKMKKKPVKKPARRIWEGFLLCRKAVGTEELAEALAQAGIVCECWHEMQVMEIPVAEGTSLDVERSEIAWEGEDAIYLGGGEDIALDGVADFEGRDVVQAQLAKITGGGNASLGEVA